MAVLVYYINRSDNVLNIDKNRIDELYIWIIKCLNPPPIIEDGGFFFVKKFAITFQPNYLGSLILFGVSKYALC